MLLLRKLFERKAAKIIALSDATVILFCHSHFHLLKNINGTAIINPRKPTRDAEANIIVEAKNTTVNKNSFTHRERRDNGLLSNQIQISDVVTWKLA